MAQTMSRCITQISPTVSTVQTLRQLIQKHSAVPSDPQTFVVSKVDDVHPNGKYGSITMTTLAVLHIPEQMETAVGAIALQTDSDRSVASEW